MLNTFQFTLVVHVVHDQHFPRKISIYRIFYIHFPSVAALFIMNRRFLNGFLMKHFILIKNFWKVWGLKNNSIHEIIRFWYISIQYLNIIVHNIIIAKTREDPPFPDIIPIFAILVLWGKWIERHTFQCKCIYHLRHQKNLPSCTLYILLGQ